jgi:hypothetical protein
MLVLDADFRCMTAAGPPVLDTDNRIPAVTQK